MRTSICAACVVACASGAANAGVVANAAGLYHNVYDGPVGGDEWFQILPLPDEGPDRFFFSDIRGRGNFITVMPNGTVSVDFGLGSGAFIEPGVLQLTTSIFGPTVNNSMVRAPFSDSSFPLRLESPTLGQPVLDGEFAVSAVQHNARTGASIGSLGAPSSSLVNVDGTTLSFVGPIGFLYRGVFETPVRVVYRVIEPSPIGEALFGTFPGCQFSPSASGTSLMGVLEIDSVNSFTATYYQQTQLGSGVQQEILLRYAFDRVDPLPAGDLNGDRSIDDADLALMNAQVGLSDEQDGFNIAADLDGNSVITNNDVEILEGILGVGCLADCDRNGEVDFNDLVSMLFAFGESDDSACDADGSGDVGFNDLVAALFVFGPC